MSKYIYGFDFGTSNSALAILDTTTGQIVHTFNEGSLLYFSAEHARDIYVGDEALTEYVRQEQRGRFMKSIKSILPQSAFKYTQIGRDTFRAEELVTLILKHLKKKADALVGEKVTAAVFGRPVVFDNDQYKDSLAQRRLLEGAKAAGFTDIKFQYEPIAAAYAYERTIKKPETVLVGDFGAGTSDFTVIRLDPKNSSRVDRRSDLLAKGGIHLAGDDFDARVMWSELISFFGYGVQYAGFEKQLSVPAHLFTRLCRWEDLNHFKQPNIRRQLGKYYRESKKHPALGRLMALIDENLGYPILKAIEQAKIDLSQQNQTNIAFSHKAFEINQGLSQAKFEAIIEPELSRIETSLNAFLSNHNFKAEAIDSVFLTGGTSMVKAVRAIFESKFSQAQVHSGDSFNSVADGLAYSHYFL